MWLILEGRVTFLSSPFSCLALLHWNQLSSSRCSSLTCRINSPSPWPRVSKRWGWEECGGWGSGAWTSLTELAYGRSLCPKRGRSGNQTMTRACRGFDVCTDAYVNFQHGVTWRIFVGEMSMGMLPLHTFTFVLSGSCWQCLLHLLHVQSREQSFSVSVSFCCCFFRST